MRLDAALVALVACASPAPATLRNEAAPQPEEPCQLPWDPRGMGQQGEVHVLAWKHDVDDRPLDVDSAIVLVVNRGTFTLAHLYSHAAGAPASWRPSWITDRPEYLSSWTFAAPPTRQELDAFLRKTEWEFAASSGFRLTAKGICAGEWRKYLGGEPWHHFGEVGPLRSTTP